MPSATGALRKEVPQSTTADFSLAAFSAAARAASAAARVRAWREMNS